MNQEAKRCGCGRVYTWEAWRRLVLAGVQITEDEGRHYLTEHRHCLCGSTLAIEYRPSAECAEAA